MSNIDRKFSSPSEYLYYEWDEDDEEMDPVTDRCFVATAKLLDMLHEEIVTLRKKVADLERRESKRELPV